MRQRENAYLHHLQSFMENIVYRNSQYLLIKSHLIRYKNFMERDSQFYTKFELPINANTMVIRDVSINDIEKATFPTSIHHTLHFDDLNPHLEDLIAKEGMICIANCYEILESLMYDLYTEYKRSYESHESHESIKEDFKTIRSLVKKDFGNNIDLFKQLKRVCEEIQAHSLPSQNWKKLDLLNWLKVLNQVRHCIVHSQFVLKKSTLSKFNPEMRKILDKYFPYIETNEGLALKLNHTKSEYQIQCILDFGYFLFKSLSIDSDLEWKIPN